MSSTNTTEQFNLQIQKLQTLLAPLLNQPLDEIQQEMSPLDKAKLNACLAYAANTLYYMYIKAKGISSQEHLVQSEMKRIQQYMQKIREIQNEKDEDITNTNQSTTLDQDIKTPNGKRKRDSSPSSSQKKLKNSR